MSDTDQIIEQPLQDLVLAGGIAVMFAEYRSARVDLVAAHEQPARLATTRQNSAATLHLTCAIAADGRVSGGAWIDEPRILEATRRASRSRLAAPSKGWLPECQRKLQGWSAPELFGYRLGAVAATMGLWARKLKIGREPLRVNWAA